MGKGKIKPLIISSQLNAHVPDFFMVQIFLPSKVIVHSRETNLRGTK